jgi:hypothetical protein
MTDYNLTGKQKELLIILVDHVREGKIREPIIPVCEGGGCSIIGIEEKFDRNLIGDLDILCEVDLLGFRYNSQGNRIYTIKQAGYDAVENNFVAPDFPAQTQINIGAIVHEVKNGNVQAVGFSSHSEVQQIVNDPLLLKASVEKLTNQLLEAIKSELHAEELVAYIQNLEDLKDQLAADKPSPTKLHKIFGLLSFVGDVEGSLSLVVRVWPYIYPLLVIAAQKI